MKEAQAARIVARLAHRGQKYGHRDYFTFHIEGVRTILSACEGATYQHAIVAYLHDVLEDTDLTAYELEAIGFSSETIRSVIAMTRGHGAHESETYAEYIMRLCLDPVAPLVKHCDLTFNANQCRVDIDSGAGGASQLRSRLTRYKRALKTVEMVLAERGYKL